MNHLAKKRVFINYKNVHLCRCPVQMYIFVVDLFGRMALPRNNSFLVVVRGLTSAAGITSGTCLRRDTFTKKDTWRTLHYLGLAPICSHRKLLSILATISFRNRATSHPNHKLWCALMGCMAVRKFQRPTWWHQATSSCTYPCPAMRCSGRAGIHFPIYSYEQYGYKHTHRNSQQRFGKRTPAKIWKSEEQGEKDLPN